MRVLALRIWFFGSLSINQALASDILILPLKDNLGFTPEVYDELDGTKIEWTEFFKSESSQVAIVGGSPNRRRRHCLC